MKKLAFISLLFLLLAACAPVRPIPATATPTNSAGTPTGPNTIPNTGSLPNFDHIVLILLENRDFAGATDPNQMPHFVDLAQKYVLLTNYFAAGHPSLPNYLALMSGSTQNVTTDCTNCFFDAPNLGDEITKSGRSWKAYLESMPSPCFIGDSGTYAQKHNPLLYFDSIRKNTELCQNSIVPLTQLNDDLRANKLPNFSFIMPDLCDSGHDCDAKTTDDWLQAMVSSLQNSSALGQNSLIAITFDEANDSDLSSCCGLGRGGGKVATVLISPSARANYTDNTDYSHYSLLKTILKAWNLPMLGRTDKSSIEAILPPWGGSSSLGGSSGSSSGSGAASLEAASPGCMASSPGADTYTVKVCLTNVTDGASLSGDVTLGAKVDVTEGSAQVQKYLFYLDGEYLATVFYSPWTLTLPTAKWPDGKHQLEVAAIMRDSFTAQKASLSVSFNNGVASMTENTNTFKPSTGTPVQAGQPFMVAAVGDGAGGGEDAAKVTDLLASLNPNLFLYLGDVYERGSSTEFYNWYGSDSTYYGQLKSVTNPTIGNHDYGADNGASYFDYWNNIPNYYSFNSAGWHFISLNSNGSKVPTNAGSDQYNWLEQDLQKNKLACTIVYYHHPLFNIGPEGSTEGMTDIWKLLAQYKVPIVLNGHDHDYQRWSPLNAEGQPDPNGITEFVVGTGGHGLQSFTQPDNRVAVSNNSNPLAFGALLLQLNSAGANFAFESTDRSILDSGVIPCSPATADTKAPSNPTRLNAVAMTSARIDLTWSPAIDNVGVAGYAIYRNGINIATVPGYSQEYSDTAVNAAANYTYSVMAFDLTGRHSIFSLPLHVTVPGVATSLAFTAEADAFVNTDSAAVNYGKTPFMRINSTPDQHAYIRFNVTGLNGRTVVRARLLVYVNNSNKQGLNVTTIVGDQWNEASIDFQTAPRIGDVIATSAPLQAGTWVSIDVTKAITGEGIYNFGLTSAATRSINIASREAGVNAPQLIIDFQ